MCSPNHDYLFKNIKYRKCVIYVIYHIPTHAASIFIAFRGSIIYYPLNNRANTDGLNTSPEKKVKVSSF